MIVTIRILDHIGSYTAGQVTHFDDELDRVFLRALFNGGKAELISPVDWVPPLSWTPLDVPVSGDTSPYLDILEHHAINHTGIPGVPQSGASDAYVPGTDHMMVESDYMTTQTIVGGAANVFTTMAFDTPNVDIGNAFELGSKGIKVLAGTLFAGDILVTIDTAPSADTLLFLSIREVTTDGGAVAGSIARYYANTTILPLGTNTPQMKIPFWVGPVTLGRWLCVSAGASGGSLVLGSFGGMDIRRIA